MDDTDGSMSSPVSFTPSSQIGRLPYLPGLDGLRAIAVAAVMIYHADHNWLPGGFLGVEVFFVISGYLITQLLVNEFEREGRIRLGQFWKRRFRRLLPALFVLLAGLAVYMAAFRRTPMGRTRGDFAGGILYISNWYQIVVGQGYTANEAFVPLRHLWSLAVEEQFYLIWPLVMVAVLVRRSGRDLRRLALWFAGTSLVVTVVTALLFHSGDVAATCTVEQRQGYWSIAGRCININESLYLGTLSRAGGLLLGAAFALVWRPLALPWQVRDKPHTLDAVGLLGIATLGWLTWQLWLSEGGRQFGIRFDPLLFRGGFLLTGVATLAVIAAVAHHRSWLGHALGFPVLNWVGTRSYGLYLYHWPIYQIIRGEAGQPLSPAQFVLAVVLTLPITEASYRFIELPIRQGRIAEGLRDRRRRSEAIYQRRRRLVGALVIVLAVVGFAGVSIALAPNKCVGPVECDLAAASATDSNPPPGSSPIETVTSTAPADTATDQTAASTTSSSSTTSTTLPLDQRPPIAIGESVMLGAKPQLEKAGFVVDAAESRQGTQVVDIVARLRAAGRLGNVVVIHIGTNGEVSDETLTAIMANLPPEEVKSVWFLTVRADRGWIDGNNGRLIALPAKYPNVQIGYWADFVPNVPGMAKDGFHLGTDEAKQIYADLIKAWALPDG
ncbi:MAG: acyltransferase family protein [Ilumatobacteraceae bacterium]